MLVLFCCCWFVLFLGDDGGDLKGMCVSQGSGVPPEGGLIFPPQHCQTAGC